jgi:5-methylcytosine-specific restriction endonuclease McrA
VSGHFGTKHNRTPICKLCSSPKYRAGLCSTHYFARIRERTALKRRARKAHCSYCKSELINAPILRRYCSARCIQSARNERERKLGLLPSTRNCKRCHKEFSPSKHWNEFCSKRCTEINRNDRLRKGTQQPERRISAICLSCGSKFEQPQRHYSTVKGRVPKFCSIACAYKERRGAKSPNFRGGTVGYRGVRWADIAEQARARDQYLCGACSVLHGRVKHSVDHVIPYRLMRQWGIDPNHFDNLQTLCRACHGRKFEAENRLLRGDLVGFVQSMLSMKYPELRIRAALQHAGLSCAALDRRVNAT